jgi:hypothetical protein
LHACALLFASALASSGCGGASNPCAGQSGVCVAVEVRGKVPLLDELDVSMLVGGRSLAGRAGAAGDLTLPVQFAGLLPAGTSGPVSIEVVGARGGVPLAYGSTGLVLPPSGQRAIVELTAFGFVPDGATPIDLSRFHVGSDLAGQTTQDFAAPPGSDLSIVPSCTGANCTLGTFVTQSATINPARTAYPAIVVGNNVYLLAGQDSTTNPSATVQRAVIGVDGNLGPFSDAGIALTTPRLLHAVARTSQFVYVSGGTNDTTLGTTVLGTVERAPINSDGTLGPFVQLAGALKTPRQGHVSVAIGNTLFIIGDETATTPIAGVEAATINADGSLGAFADAGALTTPRVSPALVLTSASVYVIGGSSTGADLDSVDRAPVGASTLSFVDAGIRLQQRRGGHTATVVGSDVYVVGGGFVSADADIFGNRPVTFPLAVERAHLDGFGALGGFSTVLGVTLQKGRGGHGAAFTGSALYVIGGYDGAAALSSIERAPLQ